MSARVLVVAKAPVPGRVKTRLGVDVGAREAAELAAAALLDTVAAGSDAVGPGHCHLALDGNLDGAVRGAELTRAVSGWQVRPQRGEGLAARLVRAHLDLADGGGPVVQVGMDTPQLTPGLLLDAAAGTERHDAVLGPAEDGGWWVLALGDPGQARALAGVTMSTSRTHDDTRRALEAWGLSVGATTGLRDVDELADAEAAFAVLRTGQHGSHFARAWRTLREDVW